MKQNPLDPFLIKQRLNILLQLESIHAALVHLDILSPRDKWEEWIDNFQDDRDCDPAFMCLIVIIMSSSTADNQLAEIVPRIFLSGLTSAHAVLDIAQQYGLDSLCSLLSDAGRFYQNTERILNAADYFMQRHDGKIPSSISVQELSSLYGVGYKTANIVITKAFRRVEGIPSDIHVIRWSSVLGWCSSNIDGFHCSKQLENWLPQSKWESVNPVFGAFGQLITSSRRSVLLELASQHSLFVREIFERALKVYNIRN
jgi:endonuclease III